MEELTTWVDGLTMRHVFLKDSTAEEMLNAWSHDVTLLRRRLAQRLQDPVIRQALFIASPSVESAITYWEEDADSKKGLQAERALVRYFSRMCTRSTPFGLFSGLSLGEIKTDSRNIRSDFLLTSHHLYKTYSRLDCEFLCNLAEELEKHDDIQNSLTYRPNTSLHCLGDSCHYVESCDGESGRRHHLARVTTNPIFEHIINKASAGATIGQLVDTLTEVLKPRRITKPLAVQYVRDLIAANILVSTLSPPATGLPPFESLLEELAVAAPHSIYLTALHSAKAKLARLDKHGLGCSIKDYEKIIHDLASLPIEVQEGRLFHVDMTKPFKIGVLGPAIMDEVARGFQSLCQLSRVDTFPVLTRFREAFTARYDQAQVPLLEALDEEFGIGFNFDSPPIESSSLLRGMQFDGSLPPIKAGEKLVGVDGFLLELLLSRKGLEGIELCLDPCQLPNGDKQAALLPDSFALNAVVLASSFQAVESGAFQIHLKGAFGPGSARTFGRFCHLDEDLERVARDTAREEEKHDRGAIYAEIAHLPGGRAGNLICRPVLREYEIPYLGRSGAPRDRQILPSDLLISVANGKIQIYSQRHGRRIIPRLTSAHAYPYPHLAPVYRFLCYLQHQGNSPVSFSWGLLERFDFLPRLRVGKTILSTARWKLTAGDIENVSTPKGQRRFISVQELRCRLNLPRWIEFEESDHSLVIDLDNPLSVDSFVHVLSRCKSAIIRELYPGHDSLCVRSDQGSFQHELTIPFVRRQPVTAEGSGPLCGKSITRYDRSTRVYPPLSDWLYLKLYAGRSGLELILTTFAARLIKSELYDRLIAQWFYIRYSDPEPHLRIRFLTKSNVVPDLVGLINQLLRSELASGILRRLQFDTYEREIERYGGVEGMVLAEELFCEDSRAAINILQIIDQHSNPDLQWRATLIGIDHLLSDFGLDLEAKCAAMEHMRDAFYSEFRVTPAEKGQISTRFRRERTMLQRLVGPPGAGLPTELHNVLQIFEIRSCHVRDIVVRYRELLSRGLLKVSMDDLLISFVHMQVNRLISSSPRLHEMILYDFLFRIYYGRRARESVVR